MFYFSRVWYNSSSDAHHSLPMSVAWYVYFVRLFVDEDFLMLRDAFSKRPAVHNVSMHSRNVLYWTFASRRIRVVFVGLAVTFMMSA